MTGDPAVWAKAIEDARLSEVERARVSDAVERDGDLRVEVTYLVERLSADLAGPFVRAFAELLGEGRSSERAAGLVLPALSRVLDPGRVEERGRV